MSDFDGFPRQTLTFLRELRRNNSTTWFETHRDDYERLWLGPARRFVAAVAPGLRSISGDVIADPRINGSIFRINRDTRFTSDKTPYKDHLDLWFWEGERRTAVSGYFFRLTPEALSLGAGSHRFDRDRLAAYRAAVTDRRSFASLRRAVTKVERSGWEVAGEHYQRAPRGFEVPGGAAERLIRHNALWVAEASPDTGLIESAGLVEHCVRRWASAAPLHRWLVANLQ